VISRCRVDIPPPTLLMGSDIIKVFPKVNNLGFVLNERLTATDHFKKVCQKVYWILRFLTPHALHTPFEVRRRFVVSHWIRKYYVCWQRLNMACRACLRYIHSLRKLDHVFHLETSVMGASLADYPRIQLLSLFFFIKIDQYSKIISLCFFLLNSVKSVKVLER
jgi:hypothetical protein